MTEKLAQAGEGGGCTPTPFHYIYHHVYKVVVYVPAEKADTLPLISTLQLYVLCGVHFWYTTYVGELLQVW
jgi:hypothetical protein